MTRTPLQFAPDPSKWIDTASKPSKSAAPTQRPLTALRHGFATPPPSKLIDRVRPPTGREGSSSSSQKKAGVKSGGGFSSSARPGIRGIQPGCTASGSRIIGRNDSQETLGRFMTPPPSTSIDPARKKKQTLERIKREVLELTGSPLARSVKSGRMRSKTPDVVERPVRGTSKSLGGKKLREVPSQRPKVKAKVEDFWHSDELDEGKSGPRDGSGSRSLDTDSEAAIEPDQEAGPSRPRSKHPAALIDLTSPDKRTSPRARTSCGSPAKSRQHHATPTTQHVVHVPTHIPQSQAIPSSNLPLPLPAPTRSPCPPPLRSSHSAKKSRLASPSRDTHLTPNLRRISNPPHIKTDSPPSEPPDPITPIPASILAMHQHLCGQGDAGPSRKNGLAASKAGTREHESGHMEGIHATLVKGTEGKMAPIRKIKKPSVGKELARLSDEPDQEDCNEEENDDGVETSRSVVGAARVLSPLRTNIVGRSRHARGVSVIENSRVNRKAALSKSKSAIVGITHRQQGRNDVLISPPRRKPDITGRGAVAIASSSTSPPPVLRALPPDAHKPSSPITPRKRSKTHHHHHHHQITPPKSRTPTNPLNLQDHTETLFAFPPPRQPVFVPSPSPPVEPEQVKEKHWEAVEMEPETLLTWSLGVSTDQPPLQQVRMREESAKSAPRRGQVGSPRVADVTPRAGEHGRRPVGEGDGPVQLGRSPRKATRERSEAPAQAKRQDSESQVLLMSEPSQSFPVLVHSSPKRPVAQPSSVPERRDSPLRAKRSGVASNTTRHDRNARAGPSRPSSTKRERWSHLDEGILSVPLPTDTDDKALTGNQVGTTTTHKSRTKTPRKGTQGRRVSSSQAKGQGQGHGHGQSKLAAYGFFAGTALGKAKGKEEEKVFDKSWEEEQDLDLDLDLDIAEGDANVRLRQFEDETYKIGLETGRLGDGLRRRLGTVPEPPHHPDLRPAGIAELRRRDAAEGTNREGEVQQLPHDPASPPLFDDDGPSDDPHGHFETEGEGDGLSTTTTPTPTTSSSLTTREGEGGDGEGDLPTSVGLWWDALGDRTSSQLGM